MSSSEKYLHIGLGWIEDKGGGLERYQHGICSAHTELGCDIEAWVQSRTATSNQPTYPAIAFASPLETRSAKVAKLKKLAAERFKNADFTLVTHHASVSTHLTGMIGHIPHVVHFQGPWADEAAVEGAPWWKTMLQRRMERRAYHSADRIITLSKAFKELVVEKYAVDPDIVHVIPGAIDTTLADPKISRVAARELLAWPLDRPIVLIVRRLVNRVGVEVLVEAVAKLLTESPHLNDLLVLIGGTGPLESQLKERIREFGLTDHVRLLGFIPDAQLPTAFRAADLSMVPTQSLEGFGLVTIESLAAGTPVIVTPVGSLPEIMTELSESLVLPGASASHLCDGLRAFAMGSLKLPTDVECQQYVQSRYDWSVVAPLVLDVYRVAEF